MFSCLERRFPPDISVVSPQGLSWTFSFLFFLLCLIWWCSPFSYVPGPDSSCYSMSVGRRLEAGQSKQLQGNQALDCALQELCNASRKQCSLKLSITFDCRVGSSVFHRKQQPHELLYGLDSCTLSPTQKAQAPRNDYPFQPFGQERSHLFALPGHHVVHHVTISYHTHRHVHIYIYTHARTHTQIYIYIYIYIHTFIIHLHTNMHINVYR